MNVTKTKSKIMLIVILAVAAVVCCSVGFVFAYNNKSVTRNYETSVTATNVSFKFNNKIYIDEIGSADILLAKGSPAEIDMRIEVTGTRSLAVDYSVSLILENASGGTDNISDVTRAIEVYRYDGSRYVFVCMLSEISGAVFSGQMTTDYLDVIPLKLIFSAEAGDYYDNLVNTSNGAFRISATASATLSNAASQYIFAKDYAAFKEAFAGSGANGKTIILSSDITVPEALVSDGKKGIDLNGHTLTLDADLTVGYSSSPADIGVINSGTVTDGVKNGGIKGNGKIHVNGDDCYLVDNYLATDKVIVSLANRTAVFDSFISSVSSALSELSDGTVYTTGSDVSSAFDNLLYYTSAAGFTENIAEESAIKRNGSVYSVSVDDEFTTDFMYDITYTDGYSQSSTVKGGITVRGNSLAAISSYLLSSVPSPINSSLFLRGYDSVTSSYIEWYIDDGFDGLVIDSDGRYCKNGLDAYLSSLSDYADTTAEIYIKITKGAETATFYASKSLETVSARQRTALIFDNSPVVLKASGGEEYDIYADYLVQANLDKAHLTGISITKVSDANNYVTISKNASNDAYSKLVFDSSAAVPQNSVTTAVIGITFSYGDKSYYMTKSVTILGKVASVTKYDVSYRLQSAFSVNSYVEGKGYSFYAYGGLTPYVDGKPVMVWIDYAFEFPETDDYQNAGLTAENGYYTSPSNENQAKNYIVTTYEYVRTARADMLTQVAYFTYDETSDSYVFASDTSDESETYYERKANFEILPSKIDTFDTLSVTIYAVLYTETINGVKIYADPTDGTEKTLIYPMSLDIDGIYHNVSGQIEDYNLYSVLRSYYDANGDGLISVKEAKADWSSLSPLDTATVNGASYDYIDFSGKDISTLKGIEYFVNAKGYDLSGTGTVDISPLSALKKLAYLDLSNNDITDISALSGDGSLVYLNLDDNSVTAVEALRHLTLLEVISLENNNTTDFEPLSEASNLALLDVRGITNGSTYFNADYNTMYYFALIKINNPAVVFDYDNAIDITEPMRVAAKAMRDLENINRIYKTLYLPNKYYYSDGDSVRQYTLAWFCTDSSLTLESDGAYTGYSIANPMFDKPVTISLQVYELGSTNAYYTLSRSFRITLETTNPNDYAYIYDSANSVYVPASVIPDTSLRNLLFGEFNNVTDGIVDIGGTEIPETRVLSAADLAYYRNNIPATVNWRGAGITNLAGIEYFAAWFSNSLDLAENDVVSLSPLASLTSLAGLTLGGKTYDFTQLTGLTSLLSLDVSECYGLDNDDTLNALYNVYLANAAVDIVIDGSADAWNPYTKLLALYTQSLPTVMTFLNQGESIDIYDNGTGYDFTFYSHSRTFTADSVTFYERYSKTSSHFSYSSNSIVYTSAFGSAETVYAQIKISSSDTHGVINYDGYYIELIADDAGDVIYVHNVSSYDDFSVTTVSALFAARSVKETLLPKLYAWFSKSSHRIAYNSDADTDEKIGALLAKHKTYFYYDEATGYYHCTTDIFTSGGIMKSVSSLTVDGAYASDGITVTGLKYLPTVTKLTVARDAVLGDGSELVNLITLSVSYSALDLTTISTYLPKLKYLSISKIYILFTIPDGGSGYDSALKYMPNLITLSVSLSSTTASDAQINDFSFLLGLITKNSKNENITNLKTLTLTRVIANYSTTGISTANAGYVKQLYLAAVKNGVSPAYKVGSTSRNNLTSVYFRVIDNLAYYCTDNSDSTKVSSWETASAADLSDARTALSDYNTVAGYMCDVGLKINSSLWTANRTFTLSTSDTLTFPASTGKNYYGLSYANADSVDERDYPIVWTVYFTNSYGAESMPVNNVTYGSDTTVSASAYGNGYLVVIGTIRSGITDAVDYSFLYHFVVGSGDGIYSAVSDITLRAYLFIHRNSVSDSVYIDGSVTDSSLLSALGKTALPLDNVSNRIYSLAGFDTVISHLGVRLTSVTLSNQEFSDISPLYGLSALTSLSLFSWYRGYAVLTGIGTSFPKLRTLDLTNNISVTPDDIALLASSASSRPYLTTINLYGTRCQGDYGVLSSLEKIAEANSNDSLTLTLNAAASSVVTAEQLTEFLNDTSYGGISPISSMLANGITDASNIYIFDSADILINDIAYTLALLPETKSMLNNYTNQIYNGNIPVTVTVSASSYNAQFSSVYLTAYFYKEGSSSRLYGSEGLPITSFDTELIAYLTVNGMLKSNSDGYYVLNQYVTISYDIGIKELDNIATLSDSSNIISIIKSSNRRAYGDEGAIYSPSAYTNENRSASFSSGSLLMLNLIDDFTYSDASATTYTATMPTHLWMSGTEYAIIWAVTGKIGTAYVDTSDFFTTDADGNVIFTLDADNVSLPSAETYSVFYIRATVDNRGISEKIKLTKLPAEKKAEGYRLMVQVNVVGEGETYRDESGEIHNTAGEVVMLDENGLIYYTLGSADYSLLYLKNGLYYATLSDIGNATAVYCVKADSIFKSGRLAHYIISTRSTHEIIYDGDSEKLQYGYLLTSSLILGYTALDVYSDTSDNDVASQNVTSLEGVQIFRNLSAFSVYAGSFTDIDTLKTLHLTSFYYGVSEVASKDERHFALNDFSPLVEGSRDTLAVFSYDTIATEQLTDMSFLLAFTNLSEIYLCSNYWQTYSDSGYAQGLCYFKTPSFKYILSRLTEKNIPIYVYSGYIAAFDLPCDTAKSVTVNGDLLYALSANAEYKKAAETLSDFTSAGVDTVLSDNYLLTAVSYDTDGGKLTFRIPATINQNGTLSVIEWLAGSANEMVNGYYLSSDATVGGTEYSASTALSYAQATAIAGSTEYYASEKAGATKLYVSVTVDADDIGDTTDCAPRLICRIRVNGYAYERMFSLAIGGEQ